ncbi:MAG: AAA-like domain-containing protein [Leptolyngbyaceae bacterium]|nr:AAA-like domain-containing protein [Leptolyngbyaceae bacterium]
MSGWMSVMPRSLRVQAQYLPITKASLLRHGFPSQKILAEDLGIAQSTVSNFLNGKPVDYLNFLEICRVLGQEWRDIANLEEPLESEIEPPTLPTQKKLTGMIRAVCSMTLNLAQTLQQSFHSAGHEVLIPEHPIALATHWQACDYWVLLLSPVAVTSELVLEEVRFVVDLRQQVASKPAIFPICVDLQPDSPCSFDLLQLLQGIQPWQWRWADPPSSLATEILTLLHADRKALTLHHPLAVDWQTFFARPILLEEPLGDRPLPVAAPELPEGQVELTSTFYIERAPIEQRCYEAIAQPGALIRIKAPRQMGKTSLMARILHQAEAMGSKTVALSFQLANKRVFTNSDTFLQWFCASVGMELGQLDALAGCWQLADMIGSNQCCKAYFEKYLLSSSIPSLTLGLDEVDRVFESPEIADDFFGLLRALHEEAKRRDVWKKFRLVVVHSTEVYIPLDVNKSPFNVGLPIELPEFTPQQVQTLASHHGLAWDEESVELLMDLVGGHPYLIRLALYHLARHDVTLSQITQEGSTGVGIYSDHLRRHLWNLEKYPDLLEAMREVVTTTTPTRLPSAQAFKLQSMGLVQLQGNTCQVRCRLYEQYFRW